jgi:hypothetical protein
MFSMNEMYSSFCDVAKTIPCVFRNTASLQEMYMNLLWSQEFEAFVSMATGKRAQTYDIATSFDAAWNCAKDKRMSQQRREMRFIHARDSYASRMKKYEKDLWCFEKAQKKQKA